MLQRAIQFLTPAGFGATLPRCRPQQHTRLCSLDWMPFEHLIVSSPATGWEIESYLAWRDALQAQEARIAAGDQNNTCS